MKRNTRRTPPGRKARIPERDCGSRRASASLPASPPPPPAVTSPVPPNTRFGRFRSALSASPPLWWALLYFFCLLCGYYVLRPVRDAMGASSDPGAVFPAWLLDWAAGRGVALGTAMGRELARVVSGTPEEELALPVTEPQPFPAHGFVRRMTPAYLAWLRRKDLSEPNL